MNPSVAKSIAWLAIAGLAPACGGGETTALRPKRIGGDELDAIALPRFDGDDPVEACVHAAGRIPADFARILQSFCAEADRLELPGASLALRDAKGRVFTAQWGSRCAPSTPASEASPGTDASATAEVDTDTRFRIGSLTKMATAKLALEVMDERGGSLDMQLDPAFGAELRQVLRHEAGTPTLDPELMRAGRWREALGATPARFEPGALWHYANDGYLLLGAWLSEYGERPYAERFEARFGPVGLALEPGADFACEHVAVGEARVAKTPEDLDLADWLAPAGGAWASASALLKLADATEADPRLYADPRDTHEGDGYAFGVRVGEEKGLRYRLHRGATGGSWSFLMWAPDGRAVAVLANQELPMQATTIAARRDLFELDEVRARSGPTDLTPFTGRYAVAGWDAPAELELEGERARLDLPGLGARGLELEARDDGGHVLRWPLSGEAVILRFVHNQQGRWLRAPLFVGRKLDAGPPGVDAQAPPPK